ALVGVSGSGKSSLLVDVVQAEASRRLLECLSLYERQSVKEGPEAPVGALEGLGPTVFVTPARPRGRRATVGTASEGTFHPAEAREERLIVRPEAPLCAGAMYSPGFFPGSYFSKPGNGGYDMLQALAARYGFDPFRTPWRKLSAKARRAFLFGEEKPLEVVFR